MRVILCLKLIFHFELGHQQISKSDPFILIAPHQVARRLFQPFKRNLINMIDSQFNICRALTKLREDYSNLFKESNKHQKVIHLC